MAGEIIQEVFLEMSGDLIKKFIVEDGIFPQSHMCVSEAFGSKIFSSARYSNGSAQKEFRLTVV